MAVYFIRAGKDGPIKIGHGSNPERRLRNLQTGTHAVLEIVAVIAGGEHEEAQLHARFARSRIRREWFEPSPDLLALIAEHPYSSAPRRGTYPAPTLPVGATPIHRVIYRLRRFAFDNHIAPSAYAIRAGLSRDALRDLYLPSWNPTIDTLRAMEAVIDEHERPRSVA
jgi:hypothetical protein